MKCASLNHISRVIWTEIILAWISVIQLVRAHGNRAASIMFSSTLLASGSVFSEQPARGQIIAGASNPVSFVQPAASSVDFNHLFGSNVSVIRSALNAPDRTPSNSPSLGVEHILVFRS